MDTRSEERPVQALTTGAHLLYVVTGNERTTEGIATRAAARVNGAGTLFVWTCTDGFLHGDGAVPATQDALAALDFALARPGPALFLMKDLAAFWRDNPFVVRKLKSFAARGGKALVVLGQDERIPQSLREDLSVFRQGLPTVSEIRSFLEQAIARNTILSRLNAREPDLLGNLLAAIGRTVPMSVTMAEQIKKNESWAFKRAVPASGKTGS